MSTWFAFQGLNDGKAINLAGSQEKEAVTEGFHGYATEAQAEANPNSVNIVTRYIADAMIADYKAAQAEQAAPGQKNANILNPATAVKAGATGVEAAASSVLDLSQINSVFHALTEGSTWVRVGEVVLGVVLVAVGVAHMTRAVPAATKIARMVA